ncbi:MAG: tryptophan-rich sensory protein [Blastochloris viridis]|uniref:Tryptophan-rich sensory protein n=1 Tax=Blastochloris viridis TaxID=1079 RepID=A0A6N4RBK6_BLAVI|nr:MAG: tryptophan-rich sensory protein [Blastochloris viridis]
MLSQSQASRATLALFLSLTVGGGLLIGMLSTPDAWYAALNKPSFNPPNWVFGPVWTVMYVLIGLAGWQTWKTRPNGLAMKLWTLQMLLNFFWTPVFFTLHRTDMALDVIVALLGTILAYIYVSYKDGNTRSARLFIPYALWVAFATSLTASIWYLN